MELKEMQEAVQEAITDIAIYKDKIKTALDDIKEKYGLEQERFEGRIKKIDQELRQVRDKKKKLQKKAERVLKRLEKGK